MNRFMGGFASAAVLLAIASGAGSRWLDAALAVSLIVPLGWALARYSRHRTAPVPPPVHPDAVFGGRDRERTQPPANRR